ncbi:hypothetical protein ACP275_08G066200 [Erythranthe tilingii]
MSLANKNDSTMAIIQASAFYDNNNFGGGPMINSSPEDNNNNHMYSGTRAYLEPESPEKPGHNFAKNFTMSNSSSVSSPSSTNSNGLGYNQAAAPNNNNNYNLSEEGNSVISFKPDYGSFSGSLLSFDHTKRARRNLYPRLIGEEDEYPLWDEDLHHHHPSSYQSQLIDPKCTAAAGHGLPETSGSHHDAAAGNFQQMAWLNDEEEDTITNGILEMGRQEAATNANNKRPFSGENVQAMKKQCVGSSSDSKKPKSKSQSSIISKDPQSVAAKNRRERISERLKILQELVPNGSKVDLVTMLEKAISYVKFLQLQVKVLAADEFWPAQGGKAPDLSQVREAIDAILASQRDTNSSCK